MTDYEYALRTVVVATGQTFETAHAVAPGTLIALCGTVAVPEPGSRWAASDPDARCRACERLIGSKNDPQAEPEPQPQVIPVPQPSSVRPEPRSVLDPPRSLWRRTSRMVRFAVVGTVLVVVLAVVVVLSTAGGFHPDQNSPAYQNGYAYGHDLMGHSNDVTGSCTQATVDDPATTDGKNFIAGCEAGYAARTP